MSARYDLNISRTSGRGPGQRVIREFYDSPSEAWEFWGDQKPEITEIRIGTLGEPSGHSDFPGFLKTLQEYRPEYITDGLVLGIPGDPRAEFLLRSTEEYCSRVILLKSACCPRVYKRALAALKETGIEVLIGIAKAEDKEDGYPCLYIPEYDQNLIQTSPEDLKGVDKIDIRPHILLGSDKIIITENSLNLKPIESYDRF